MHNNSICNESNGGNYPTLTITNITRKIRKTKKITNITCKKRREGQVNEKKLLQSTQGRIEKVIQRPHGHPEWGSL